MKKTSYDLMVDFKQDIIKLKSVVAKLQDENKKSKKLCKELLNNQKVYDCLFENGFINEVVNCVGAEND